MKSIFLVSLQSHPFFIAALAHCFVSLFFHFYTCKKVCQCSKVVEGEVIAGGLAKTIPYKNKGHTGTFTCFTVAVRIANIKRLLQAVLFHQQLNVVVLGHVIYTMRHFIGNKGP